MIRAINDIVIVLRDGYQGLIYVKDQKMSFGTILSVGPGRLGDDIHETKRTGKAVQKFLYTSPDLKEGVRVYFDESLGKDFTYEGKTYLMIKESHIAGIIEDESVSDGDYDITIIADAINVNSKPSEFPFERINGKDGNLDMDYRMVAAEGGY